MAARGARRRRSGAYRDQGILPGGEPIQPSGQAPEPRPEGGRRPPEGEPGSGHAARKCCQNRWGGLPEEWFDFTAMSSSMGKPLIIVESPAKAKSMMRYLDNEFMALASFGHVRDLPSKEGAVDPTQDFQMRYEIIPDSKKHVDRIVRAMKKADALYLATDPDREGEAISWHLYELLKERHLLRNKPVYRVEFHEITRQAIRQAVDHPRELSHHLIDAYQARRALDHLVGFNLSPLLWRKIRAGLSAGRVQSPALRLICERDEEIARFVPQEYWTVEADCRQEETKFVGKLIEFEGKKLAKFAITNADRAAEVEARLSRATVGSGEGAATEDALSGPSEARPGQLRVSKVTRKQVKESPKPPFTTSTLQQEASHQLGFTTRRTMQVAQQLYEGTGTGTGGLITYMRTDSVALANEALAEIRALIRQRYGADQVPPQPRFFKNQAKNAQEAHEAIRPTSAHRAPETLRGQLTSEQFRLYDLIWKRAVACQMGPAVFDTVSVDLAAEAAGTFRANGRHLRVPGYRSVYREESDGMTASDEPGGLLPHLTEGDLVHLTAIRPLQHFTEPPPRFNEASLVKTLEEHGIGRPSTWANIISTLQRRAYVTLEKRRFQATDLGKIVNHFLSRHFTPYVDYEFTARLEDALDAISRGEKEWVPLMREFWGPFEQRLAEKQATVRREDLSPDRLLGRDPKHGKPVIVRMGRYGPLAQIGSRDDEEKPIYASLLPTQTLDQITLEEALDLFRLPRDMGETPEGEPLVVAIGRFGPYVRYGNQFVSLNKENDPYTVDRETVLRLVAEKKERDANRIIQDFGEGGVQVLNGRWGPYITNGETNARIPKDIVEPKTLTLADCQELLKNGTPVRRKKKTKKKANTRKSASASQRGTRVGKSRKVTSRKKAPSRKSA